jgi:hypothetical protein
LEKQKYRLMERPFKFWILNDRQGWFYLVCITAFFLLGAGIPDAIHTAVKQQGKRHLTRQLLAQGTLIGGQFLRGKVHNAKTGAVLPMASLKISGGHSTVTDSEGYYALDLAVGDKAAPGTVLTIYLMDAKLGNDMVEVVVPADLSRDVRLEFKSDRYHVVAGTVVDKTTQALLPGIRVRAVPDEQGWATPPPAAVVTDEMGWFWIILDKEKYGNVSHVQLSAQDLQSGNYRDWSGLEQARSGIVIELDPLQKMFDPIPPNGGGSSTTASMGTICIKNETHQLVLISVHKTHPSNSGLYEYGAVVETKIGFGEEPCFDQIAVGSYKVVVHDPQIPSAHKEVYSAQVQRGMSSKILIR